MKTKVDSKLFMRGRPRGAALKVFAVTVGLEFEPSERYLRVAVSGEREPPVLPRH